MTIKQVPRCRKLKRRKSCPSSLLSPLFDQDHHHHHHHQSISDGQCTDAIVNNYRNLLSAPFRKLSLPSRTTTTSRIIFCKPKKSSIKHLNQNLWTINRNPIIKILLLCIVSLCCVPMNVRAPGDALISPVTQHQVATILTSQTSSIVNNPKQITTTTRSVEDESNSNNNNFNLISNNLFSNQNNNNNNNDSQPISLASTTNFQQQSNPTLTNSTQTSGGQQQQSAASSKLSGHLRFEFQRYDGWYNNLANSDWGTPNSRLRRKVAPAYSDGVYQMSEEGRPSARVLSQKMMRGEDGLGSRRNLTTLFAFFGQLISSEVLMASELGCPLEMHRIKIDKCDPMYDRECKGGKTMPFYRAAYDPTTGQSPNLPREQLNRVTSWIDGSFIYSTSETWLNSMRSFDGHGTLKMVSTPAMQTTTTSAAGAPTSSKQKSTTATTTTTTSMQKQHHHHADSSLMMINENGHTPTHMQLIKSLLEAANAAAATGSDATSSSAASIKAAEEMMAMAPMFLFGYPMRNKQRAPLQNHMPAHHLKVKTAERMFLLGDPRTNQNPIILALGILFYRWHNVLAERIYAQHPDWSDEEIFQRARRLVIASLQNIILYEFLPVLLDTPPPYGPHARKQQQQQQFSNKSMTTTATLDGSISELIGGGGGDISGAALPDQKYDQLDLIRPYTGYKPDLHPGISHVFQSAAFRFGHTLIPPGLYLRDHKCHFLETKSGFKGIRLCSTWWNAEEVISQVGIEQLLMGASSQIAEREDYVLCNDVRDKLFGTLDFNRRDLAALNIMRGRDNGIADYNSVRQAFKLPKIATWREINPDLYSKRPEIFDELASLYKGRIDRIDLYVGGMLESDIEHGRPGPLFRRIIKEQFERLRDSDRFWFENLESGIFSAAEIEQIKQISLYDIIVNSTLIPDDSIQQQVFQFSAQDPCPQPGQLSSSQLQPCYAIEGHSYFKGNELPYMLVCLVIILVPLVCHLIATCLINRQERLRRHLKTKQEYQRNMRASPTPTPTTASQQLSSRACDENGKPTRTTSGKTTIVAQQQIVATHKADKFYTKEWLHSNLKRKIKIRFGPAPDEALYVLDRRCQVQRRLDLSQTKTIVVELSSDASAAMNGAPQPLQSAPRGSLDSISSLSTRRGSQLNLVPESVSRLPNQVAGGNGSPPCNQPQFDVTELDQPTRHKPMVLIRVERNYDLVLQFCDVQQRRRFLFRLQAYLHSVNKCLELFRVSREIMLANAETKEKRQQRLEQFFREAYALTFSSSASASTSTPTSTSGNSSPSNNPDVGFVMNTSLSRQEFAEALGMRSDSLFVKQMFNCIDKDANGRISFQEFLDTVALFSRGKPDDKLRIIFDMCVTDRRGLIEKQDLVRVLRSLIDMAKTRALSELEVMQMIDEMFKTVNLQDKQLLSYEDFKLIINCHNESAVAVNGSTHDQSCQTVRAKNTTGLFCNQAGLPIGETIIGRSLNVGSQLMGQNRILAIGLDMKGANRNFFVDTSAACAAQAEAIERDRLFADAGENRPPASPVSGDHHRHMSSSASSLSASSSSSSSSSSTNSSIGGDQSPSITSSNQPISSHSSKQNTPSKDHFWVKWARAIDNRWRAYITELEQHGKDIIYMLSFFVIVIVLFTERFIQYSFLSEHMDLRHVMGVGIAITRGSAASLSFCYAMLLITMCRNLMTRLRTTSLGEYLPLDSHVKFHKVIAMTALVMTILHSVGHCVNFFHVTQQPVEHLRCLTKEMQFSVEARPTFTYWIFQTVTGSTGILLWILCSILYVFAQPRVRQKAYKYFWSAHKLYYLIYVLTLLHGSSKLTGSPKFWIFFIIPAILFAIDKVISLQTKLLELEIFETECLPSDVISIKFARPPSFRFMSGQWVRIACTAFRPHEFHAFTLTSAPQDDFLSVHIRAQGPWTWKLRSLFDPANLQYNHILNSTLPPRIRIDGPFGGGNQDWYKYEVAVMICGGIGVTPYASILNDLVFNTSTNRYSGVSYKKIYFIWICPSHRNFEWFIDVLRDVEKKDVTNLLEMHIFITQFFHKFDLRTTMLYICENHFQRISNRSLFTGLRAVNHFGRPDIAQILEQVQNKHAFVNKVGVLSCGPKALTKSVERACAKVNNKRKSPLFLHQCENFS